MNHIAIDLEVVLDKLQIAITLCEESDTLRLLHETETELKKVIYRYMDDGK